MLGEKLELHDIPFLFQEHTTMSKVIEAVERFARVPGRGAGGREGFVDGDLAERGSRAVGSSGRAGSSRMAERTVGLVG